MFLTFGFFLIPIIVILHGTVFYEDTPKRNSNFGYRTKLSMLTDETYAFANKKLNEYLIRFNYCSLVLMIVACIFYRYNYINFSDTIDIVFFSLLSLVHIVCCFTPFYYTKRDLENEYGFLYDKYQDKTKLRVRQTRRYSDLDD